MAKITKITLVCDRCKKEIPHNPWAKQLYSCKTSKMKVTKLVAQYPATSGWTQVMEAELCAECAEELNNWLNVPEVSS